jgi:hypothetical protein
METDSLVHTRVTTHPASHIGFLEPEHLEPAIATDRGLQVCEGVKDKLEVRVRGKEGVV